MKRLYPATKLKILPLGDIVNHNEAKEKKFQSPLEKPKREIKSEGNGIIFYK